MASVPMQDLPGLTVPLNEADLYAARQVYNAVLEIDDLPYIPSEHFDNLAKMFVKHNVQGIFGVGLIHRHCTLKEDEVMLNTQLQGALAGCWNKVAKITAIEASSLRGHMFTLAKDEKLLAYKLEQGSVTDLSIASPAFFREFAKYIDAAGLSSVLGLQVLNNIPASGVEFDFGEVGTVLLDNADAKHGLVSHTTGWVFSVDEEGLISCKGNTVHTPTVTGPHKVFVDSKVVANQHELEELLRRYGVL